MHFVCINSCPQEKAYTLHSNRKNRDTSRSKPYDTVALERVVKQRLRDVEMRALHDLLKDADVSAESVKDLLAATAGLIIEVSDLDTKSHAVATAMFRGVLSLGIADLAQRKIIDDQSCPAQFFSLADLEFHGGASSSMMNAEVVVWHGMEYTRGSSLWPLWRGPFGFSLGAEMGMM